MKYRMVPKICMWPSAFFYKDDLRTAAAALQQQRTERQAPMPVSFCHLTGKESYTDNSWMNKDEVDAVEEYVDQLLRTGTTVPKDIGIISPYRHQVKALKECLSHRYPAITVETVDKFQGQEKACILFSCVRSNDRGACGFLTDGRRLNVAITRAKKQFTMFGNAWTLVRGDKDGSWGSFLTHTQMEGCLLQKKQNQWVPNKELVRQDNQVKSLAPRTKPNLSIPRNFSITLTAADRAELLQAGRNAAQLLSACRLFRDILLPYVCSLPDRSYKWEETPKSCLKWNQKSWSHIYQCVTYGFKDDPGNSSYSYGMHLLLIELSPIGRNFARLQEMHKRIARGDRSDALEEAMGDVLEAVGGISDIRSIPSRRLQAHLHAQYKLDNTAFRDVSDKFKIWHISLFYCRDSTHRMKN